MFRHRLWITWISLGSALMFLLGSRGMSVDAGIQAEPVTQRVSVSNSGEQGNGYSHAPALSGNGRFVVFLSESTNLVPGDLNHYQDVFLFDRLTNRVELISVSTSGEQGNEEPSRPSMSPDGRYVVFSSKATNLVNHDINLVQDVFLRDRLTGVTELISLTDTGGQGNKDSFTRRPAISADGRYVVFYSQADNLTDDEDVLGYFDIYLRDRVLKTTVRLTEGWNGDEADGDSQYPTISADGLWVAFYSSATNLVKADTNGKIDVFLYSLESGETQRVSVSSSGEQGNDDSDLAAISGDGQYVAFFSLASNLVISDTNEASDIFVHALASGETMRISVDSLGSQAEGDSDVPAISADGRYVTFYSYAENLAADDDNGYEDVFRHDRLTGETMRVSVGVFGEQGNNSSMCSAISGDGQVAAFYSFATNLVPEDTNNQVDVFVRDLTPLIPRRIYLPVVALTP